MADKKEEAFKVTDKRSSSGTQDVATEKIAEGDGFTMKSTKEEAPNEIDFSTLVYSFAKKVQKNIVMAKQNIEILVMLQNKTKGNLSVEEAKFLENILMEVRLRFVETSR